MTRQIAKLSGVVSTVRDDIDTGGDRAMTAALAFERSTWDELVQIWQHLDLPNKAWRAEIIEESIVMTPPPGHGHNWIANRVHRVLAREVPDEWGIFQTSGVAIPLRSSLFIPDVVVIPLDAMPTDDDPTPIPAGCALLAVEITSKSNAERDRKTKLWSYAHAGVPLYLLIDRFAGDGPSVLLYSEPLDGHYRRLHRVPFGDPIELPEPFGLTLDTKEF
ncbi:Uma2 family endonuclease [Saccharopolyspora sp. K220]|uniref:Uma2 family endonuclease n=1 Tax=Saccharopolyspora soli TaxID=2926618 RepID=UPI001F5627A3|nr:Uma2 family endonuclease [Saccharopolyspora soli]MCI2422591.1 Uma2 family endonuclease [Saccharopolyspora soli]